MGLLEGHVLFRTAFLDFCFSLERGRSVVLLFEFVGFGQRLSFTAWVFVLARRFCAGFTQCTGAVFFLHDFLSLWIRCMCGYDLGG